MLNDGTEREALLRILDIVTELIEGIHNEQKTLSTRGAAGRLRVARSLLKSLKQKRSA